jgi:hypothetical protein
LHGWELEDRTLNRSAEAEIHPPERIIVPGGIHDTAKAAALKRRQIMIRKLCIGTKLLKLLIAFDRY